MGSFQGHFAFRAEKYEGHGNACFKMSCKTVVDEVHAAGQQETVIRDALRTFVRGLPFDLRAGLCNADINTAVHSKAVRDGLQKCPIGATESAELAADVAAVRSDLRHCVISEIDKCRGKLFIMCPFVQWHVMQAAWPNELDRYDVVDQTTTSERRILRQMARTHAKRGWERLGKLYGIDQHGHENRAELPRVYATIKDKCIPTDGVITKIKARPITPHTKVPLKRVYRTVATAFLFVLQRTKQQRTCRLWTTAEQVPKCQGDYKKMCEDYGKALKLRHVF